LSFLIQKISFNQKWNRQ